MPRPDAEQDLVPSVLDRLIDLDPQSPAAAEPRRPTRLPELKAAVRRDLEWLLNSRRVLAEIPESADHLRDSLLSFGLPDFSHASLENPHDRESLRRLVAEAVARFEPRLAAVEVALLGGEGPSRGVRFRIDGLLRVDPAPEPVSFDSTLRLPTRDFVVED